MDAPGRSGSASVSSFCRLFNVGLTSTFLASVYRVPLQAPAAMVRELRAKALSLEPMFINVSIKHPLVCSLFTLLTARFLIRTLSRPRK